MWPGIDPNIPIFWRINKGDMGIDAINLHANFNACPQR
jgi:hypothetical protein